MSDVREHIGDEQGTVMSDDESSSTEASPAESSLAESSLVGAAPERSARETRVRGTGGRSESDPESTSSPADASEAANPVNDSPVENGAEDDSSEDDSSEDDEEDSENTLEGEAEIAADYLEELLDIADLDGDIDTYIEGDRAHVSIVTDSEVLVGANGEVLDALQELTRLAVMTDTGDRSRLMLDVAGFRDRRRQQLIALAGKAAEEAKASQQPVPLAAMNPFERKIVHDAVAAAGLSSESEGDEPKRYVVVQPQA